MTSFFKKPLGSGERMSHCWFPNLDVGSRENGVLGRDERPAPWRHRLGFFAKDKDELRVALKGRVRVSAAEGVTKAVFRGARAHNLFTMDVYTRT
jgi:hypothetical protein